MGGVEGDAEGGGVEGGESVEVEISLDMDAGVCEEVAGR